MRYESIDILKGVAVIFMIIFHVFYFPNQFGYKEFNYDTKLLHFIARTAQIIFKTGVGLNMYISYYNEEEKKKKTKKTKSEFIKKQLFRVLKLIVLAIFISIFSYLIFGDKFVKFGILHFMSFSSLLLIPFIDSQKILIGIIVIILIIRYFVKTNILLFSNVPPKLAFITGIYSRYQSVDHFPLIPWIIFICIGLILGKVITNKKNENILIKDNKTYKKVKENKIVKGIEWCGKKSLEIYVIHWIILFIFFAYIYPKIKFGN